MINVSLICLGRLKEPYLRDACTEYCKRLSGAYKLTVEELSPVRLPDSPSEAQITGALRAEAQLIRQKIPHGACTVSLCVEGKPYSSEQLSDILEKKAASGTGSFAFIIGSSYGLDGELKAMSDIRLSMSAMTFPHQLARVMLLEQLYRAAQIRLGTKYHK